MVSKNAINCRLQAPGLPYYFIRLNTGALFQEGGGGGGGWGGGGGGGGGG